VRRDQEDEVRGNPEFDASILKLYVEGLNGKALKEAGR
jgi:hypothetical protein